MNNQIEVTRMHKVDGLGNIKAFCDISLFDALVIKGFTIMNSKNGTFVSLPRQKNKEGNWYDTIYFSSQDVKKAIETSVLSAYAQ
jgi:DNA-binding cell septation regulator SpoVG